MQLLWSSSIRDLLYLDLHWPLPARNPHTLSGYMVRPVLERQDARSNLRELSPLETLIFGSLQEDSDGLMDMMDNLVPFSMTFGLNTSLPLPSCSDSWTDTLSNANSREDSLTGSLNTSSLLAPMTPTSVSPRENSMSQRTLLNSREDFLKSTISQIRNRTVSTGPTISKSKRRSFLECEENLADFEEELDFISDFNKVFSH